MEVPTQKGSLNKNIVTPDTHTPIPVTPSKLTLMEIAGYAHISATACQVTLPNLNLNINTEDSDKKVFIPVYFNKLRAVGCIDPGSDLTIMHKTLYLKIFR